MLSFIERKIIAVWIVLLILTAGSWWLTVDGQSPAGHASRIDPEKQSF